MVKKFLSKLSVLPIRPGVLIFLDGEKNHARFALKTKYGLLAQT
jgi:hypothetical protein